MPPPEREPRWPAPRLDLLAALALGGLGLVTSFLAKSRPYLGPVALFAWVGAVLTFGATCRGWRISASAGPVVRRLLQRRRSRRVRSSWTAGWARAAWRRCAHPHVTLPGASVAAACLATVLATRAWPLVPIALAAWVVAARLIGLRWQWLLTGAIGFLAAAAVMTAFGAANASEKLAVVSYVLVCLACGMAFTARSKTEEHQGPPC